MYLGQNTLMHHTKQSSSNSLILIMAGQGFEATYSFLMDLILAFILSGLLLAVIKRFSSRVVGMKKTTKSEKHLIKLHLHLCGLFSQAGSLLKVLQAELMEQAVS